MSTHSLMGKKGLCFSLQMCCGEKGARSKPVCRALLAHGTPCVKRLRHTVCCPKENAGFRNCAARPGHVHSRTLTSGPLQERGFPREALPAPQLAFASLTGSLLHPPARSCQILKWSFSAAAVWDGHPTSKSEVVFFSSCCMGWTSY